MAQNQVNLDQILVECGLELESLEEECTQEKLLSLAAFCDSISVVGVALGLTKTQISDIENDHRTAEEKRVALLQTWKQSCAFTATYKRFTEALLACGRADQATEVCRQLVTKPKDTVDQSQDTPSVALEPESHDTPTPPETSDVFDNSVNDQQSVIFDLEAKVNELENEYRSIGEQIGQYLLKSEVSMSDLKMYAANLPALVRRHYEELKTSQLSSVTKGTTSIDDFVGVLNNYSNFLNPALLGDAVKKFGDAETKLLMDSYNIKLQAFQATTKLVEFASIRNSWEGVTPKFYEEIELKLEHDWREKTFKDIAPPKRSWLFKKVYYGSLRVVFSIADLRDLEEEDVREYLQCHVKRVFVNGKCVLNFESDETISDQTGPEESESVQLTEISSDFRFSSISHGKDITLSEDGLEARRRAQYGNGGVYVATPLQGTCEFEVEVTDYDIRFGGSLKIGVGQCPTGPYKHLDIPHKISHTKKDSCVWSNDSVYNGLGSDVIKTSYGSMDLRDLKPGDKVAVRLSENGDLHFFLSGMDEGLASRNVHREGWDTYPLICVYGSCKAVKITRAVIPEYAKGHRGQQSSENISPHNIQFGFHPVTGENIMLLEDGLYARRIDPESDRFGGVVYGAMPINHRGIFEVVITEHEHDDDDDYSIQIGVMRQPTNIELKQSDVPEYSEKVDNHFVWMGDKVHSNLSGRRDDDVSDYGRVNLLDLQEQDKVGLRLSSDGTLSFFVNGKNQGVALRGLHQEGYVIYPMVDITWDCHAVRITRAETHSDEVLDLQELCVEKIASFVDWSSNDVNLLSLPQRLKNQIEQYIEFL